MESLATLGIITRSEVMERGQLPGYLVDYRVRDGSLNMVHPGVYRFRGAPESWDVRAYALLRYAGEKSALSHHTAAHLHGLDGFEVPPPLHLLVPETHSVRPPGVTVHRTREAFETYRLRDLLRATTLARTLIDLSAVLRKDALEAALHSAWRSQRTIGPWLRATVEKLNRPPWRGVDRLLGLVDAMKGAGCDSAFELRVLRTLRSANVAPERQQQVLSDRDGRILAVDFTWPARRVALHADGAAWHTLPRDKSRDDAQRQRIHRLGWTQLVVTPSSFRHYGWLRQLHAALGTVH